MLACMADDGMARRRERAAAAFIQRRGELRLTQEDVANRAQIALRTVQNFEYGRWPNPLTRARLEKAVGWPAGEIHRLSLPPQPEVDPQLVDRLRELSAAEREWSIRFLAGLRDEEARARRRGGG